MRGKRGFVDLGGKIAVVREKLMGRIILMGFGWDEFLKFLRELQNLWGFKRFDFIIEFVRFRGN